MLGERRAARDEERFDPAAIQRTAGTETIPGNEIALQFEGSSTFQQWLECIARAERFVYFENYVVRDDNIGRAFREALADKAREGVPVHVMYDWVGCWATPRSYWKPLVRAGAHVLPFHRPTIGLGNPFGIVQRDHRKLICVDGETAFVGGFCIGDEWAGTEEAAPWRDTGIEIRGPAARAAGMAFERLWAEVADPIFLASTLSAPEAAGDTPVWLFEGEPGRARVYRSLHLSATRARRRIWITDAYFVAPRSLSEALGSAARDGVDVRILVPAHNNWPIVGTISRGGYRGLLEAGVRLFEWQGPMIHAKTSVVDGIWSRVGSSNLNGASLMGNWELDVGVLDRDFARQLEGLFLADLTSSVEIVLPGQRRPGASVLPSGSDSSTELLTEPPTEPLDPEGSLPERLEQQLRGRKHGVARMSLASVVRARFALGQALAGDRTLGREDRTVLGTVSVVILVMAAVAALAPRAVGWSIAVVFGWLGVTTGIRAFIQARRARREERRAKEELRLQQERVQARNEPKRAPMVPMERNDERNQETPGD